MEHLTARVLELHVLEKFRSGSLTNWS